MFINKYVFPVYPQMITKSARTQGNLKLCLTVFSTHSKCNLASTFTNILLYSFGIVNSYWSCVVLIVTMVMVLHNLKRHSQLLGFLVVRHVVKLRSHLNCNENNSIVVSICSIHQIVYFSIFRLSVHTHANHFYEPIVRNFMRIQFAINQRGMRI